MLGLFCADIKTGKVYARAVSRGAEIVGIGNEAVANWGDRERSGDCGGRLN